MIGLLFFYFKTAVICILLNDYMKRNYPDKYTEFVISVSFKIIRFYSKGQILFNKLFLQLNTLIDSNPQIKKILNDIYKKNIQKNQIYKINDDSIHIKCYTTDTETYFEHDDKSIYLFADNEKAVENKCINRVILRSQPFLTKYEVSNIKFILVEVKINDKTYKVNFKTDTFNYYIVDNIFDLKFFKYFLNNYQICNLTAEDRAKLDKLEIKIIDHNVNTRELEITDDKFIIIKKDDYIC